MFFIPDNLQDESNNEKNEKQHKEKRTGQNN
jgi:hypothetical protein